MDMDDTYVYANPNPQLAMSIMLWQINLMAYHSLTREASIFCYQVRWCGQAFPVCFTVIRAKERERRGTGEAAEWYWRLLSNRRPEIVVMMLSLSIGGGGGIRNLGLFLLFIRLADIFAKNSSTS